MSSNNLRQFTLSSDQAADLRRVAEPPSSGSQATMDPVYRQRLNEWWMTLGKALGFIWSTVADLDLDAEPATFRAVPEVATMGTDGQAIRWVDGPFALELAKVHGIPIHDGKWVAQPARSLALEAFDAGRSAGFAMGVATVQAKPIDTSGTIGLMEELAITLDELIERNGDDMIDSRSKRVKELRAAIDDPDGAYMRAMAQNDLREALGNLAAIMEHDCGCPPCEGSDAPAEHWLGVALRLLGPDYGQPADPAAIRKTVLDAIDAGLLPNVVGVLRNGNILFESPPCQSFTRRPHAEGLEDAEPTKGTDQ